MRKSSGKRDLCRCNCSSLDGADASLQNDEYQYGFIAGEEAGRWIQEKLGGEAEFVVLANDAVPLSSPEVTEFATVFYQRLPMPN